MSFEEICFISLMRQWTKDCKEWVWPSYTVWIERFASVHVLLYITHTVGTYCLRIIITHSTLK